MKFFSLSLATIFCYCISNAQTPTTCFAGGVDEYQQVAPPQLQLDNRSATFQITYTGFDSTKQAAFQAAADIWSTMIFATVPIKYNVILTALTPGLLGITFPNGRKDFTNAPMANTWYATSLANQIAGVELNPGESDVDMYLNANINWYFGTDGNCPTGKYDFESIVLHEMCHGLGYVSLGKVANGLGSFGTLTAADFAPLTTSFTWPALDTLPDVFDTYLVNNNNQPLLDTNFFPSFSSALQFAMTNDQVYWSGQFGMQGAGGVKPRMYAPPTYQLGSSLSHLNESTYPVLNQNELMTPQAGSGSSNHNPGTITVGILKDLGWQVNEQYLNTPYVNEIDVQIFPVPASDVVQIVSPKIISGIQLFDVSGKLILQNQNINQTHFEIHTSSLTKGVYFLQINTDGKIVVKKLVCGG